MKKIAPLASLTLAATLAFSGCETPGESAMAGAIAGSIIGGTTGSQSGVNVLRGAAIGAGAGYLVGKVAQADRRDRYYDEAESERYYDREAGYYRERPRYPVARLTSRPGFVRSPYYPNNRIDVRGIPPGARVVDPSADRIFINP